MVLSEEDVEQYLDGNLHFKELKQKIGGEATEAVRESEKQLNQAEDLAEELSEL